MSYINYTIRSNGSRISNRHLFGKTILFVMREVMWNRIGIRLVAGKCSLGRQVLRAIHALSRLFTWELKSQTAVWDSAAESLFSESRGRNGGSRRCWKQLIWHHWETLHNEPRSFQAKPQQNTHIYSSDSGVSQRQIHLSILVQFLISLNDSLMLLLMIPLVVFSKKEQKTTTFWEVVEFDKVDGWMDG